MSGSREEFTKARIKYERATVRLANLERLVERELSKARGEVNHWLNQASDLADAAGYCRWCFLPLSEGKHDGEDHVAYAVAADKASEVHRD